MQYSFKINLTRDTLDTAFNIEPQEIDTVAPISTKLLKAIEQKANELFMEKECFKLCALTVLNVSTYIGKQRIEQIVNATLKDVIDYYGNSILNESIKLGKI